MKEEKKNVRVGLFAGTTEGRLLAGRLAGANVDLDVFVATEYGKEGIRDTGHVHVFCGRMEKEEMLEKIRREAYAAVVDATHPYAELVSGNIRYACGEAGVPLLRVLREQGCQAGPAPGMAQQRCQDSPGADMVIVPNVEGAVAFLGKTEGNILVTTGSKELAAFQKLPDWENRVYARVLSLPEVVAGCAGLGFYGSHLIAMQGPFSAELNEALLKSVKAKWMVTKESGKAGGFEEKREAAARAGAGLVVIGRPKEEGMFLEEAWACLKENFGIQETEVPPASKASRQEKRKVWIVGAGPGAESLLTAQARGIFSESQVLIGAKRLMDGLETFGKPCYAEYRPAEVVSFLKAHPEYERSAVAVSGDPGFYSGAKGLLEALKKEPEFEVSVVPGISSLSYFFSAVGKSWEGAKIVSLHGREADWGKAVRENRLVFLLAGTGHTLKEVCAGLLAEGLLDVRITVGERLSMEEERIFEGSPGELEPMDVDPLSVFIIENPHAGERNEILTHGMPDEAFLRGEVPMTKREVRSVSLSKLELTKGAVVYDVGAGTGSVSVECARLSPSIQVYALERKPEAIELLGQNKARFGLPNLEIVEGAAPESIKQLPPPTHVFVGGSGGRMADILDACLEKNPHARFVVNAVTVESIGALSGYLKTAPVKDVEYTLLSAARSKQAGASRLMLAQNPVWIVSFRGEP